VGRRCARCTSYWRVPEKALFSSFVEAAVISSSPGELEPVFQTMLENATRVCGAEFGILFRYEGGLFHPAASNNLPSAFSGFPRSAGVVCASILGVEGNQFTAKEGGGKGEQGHRPVRISPFRPRGCGADAGN
jgi:hypothetical protein